MELTADVSAGGDVGPAMDKLTAVAKKVEPLDHATGEYYLTA